MTEAGSEVKEDPKLLEALVESRKGQAPYAGAFLLKDEAVYDDTDEKKRYDLKGKELFNLLHEVARQIQRDCVHVLFSSRVFGRSPTDGYRKPCSGYHQLKKMTSSKIFAAEDLSGRSMAMPGEQWPETLMRRSVEALLVEKITVEQQRLGVDESNCWEMKDKGKKRMKRRRKRTRGLDSWPQY
ncbi:unnamed protein product [Fraxinus pennsylvanica]|uniref:Uncharacterized protein n=1 Tax=Fraxinus pennsylvanica TaxID=56036 RepID=A0AAD1ZRL4_9LAMI|nr:unnamed protein product [Fraxinus pennsylvanica]